jgi:hypothetical protein
MNTNTIPALPAAITRYFDAANRFDAESAGACFTPDAVVRDEGQTRVGTSAITDWVAHASEKYQPQAAVIAARGDGDKTTVTARVTGQFPGSPAELTFVFVLRGEKIAELTIG